MFNYQYSPLTIPIFEAAIWSEFCQCNFPVGYGSGAAGFEECSMSNR